MRPLDLRDPACEIIPHRVTHESGMSFWLASLDEPHCFDARELALGRLVRIEGCSTSAAVPDPEAPESHRDSQYRQCDEILPPVESLYRNLRPSRLWYSKG